MKDYHDLLLLIRKDVVNKKKVKKAIRDTFTNRGTNFQKLSISKEQISIIQNYWNIYFKTLDAEIQKELNSDIQSVMDEINMFLEDGIL